MKIKISIIIPGIKKYKSVIKKKKKKHDKIVLLAKTKLNTVEVLTYEALIDSNIIHEEFFSVNNMPKEYDHIKEEIKNVNKYVQYNQANIRSFVTS